MLYVALDCHRGIYGNKVEVTGTRVYKLFVINVTLATFTILCLAIALKTPLLEMSVWYLFVLKK